MAGGVFVEFDASLNSIVKKLRRALNDDAQEPRYIETYPRQGYRFIGAVKQASPKEPRIAQEKEPAETNRALESAEDESAEGSVTIYPTGQSNPVLRLRRKQWKWIAGAGAAVLVGIAVFWVYGLAPKAPPATPAVRVAPVKQVLVRSSIALVGFKNLSGRRDADWLSTAITEILATELGKGQKVRIIPEENVARAKLDLGLTKTNGYPLDTLRALDANLGCDYVITGSYLVVGDNRTDQVRLDLQLQEAISGETLASNAVTGKQSEVLDLFARAAEEMRVKLGPAVPPEGDVDWRTVLPFNPEAARLYSEGLERLRVFENLAACELLQKSLAIEPSFALGHAALAEAWFLLGYEARAVASAQQALSLSASLPEDERLAIEGRYYTLKQDWAGATGVYRHLWQDFPDDLESGLKLAAAQESGADLKGALATLTSLRSLPIPLRDDPRIDLAEASLAERTGDYRREQALAAAAAKKAESSGARLLMEQAKLVEARALKAQSELQDKSVVILPSTLAKVIT